MGRGIAQLCCFMLKSSRRSSHGHRCSWVVDILSETKYAYPFNLQRNKHCFISCDTRLSGSQSVSIPLRFDSVRLYTTRSSSRERARKEATRSDLTTQDEDPFDSLTDKIPQKPVTFAEGASYSFVILFGFAIAGFAAYGVFKELIFEPKEYKVFNKALNRVQSDNQVTVRIGSPITGYGQDTRNRAARQHIPHRAWSDEDGVQRVEVQFYVRGPHGYGRVHSEMFKDKEDRQWKFTYLIVDIIAPSPTRLMLESYVPA